MTETPQNTTRPIALVTGASRGIGRAIAHDLGRDHHVVCGATSVDGAQAIADELDSASTFVCDVTSDTDLAAAVGKLGLERLDVLVHNAGINDEGTIAETERDRWRRIFEVNVFAVAELSRLLLPALRAARGTVVMINSGSGYMSGPKQGPYSGTKFALRALTMAMREEERGTVRVCSVHPGKVDTDMQVEIQTRRGNGPDTYDGSVYVRPESIAGAVRLCVDTTDESIVEEVTVRPVRRWLGRR
ncbi:SDR family oxidoreductase [Corynebacterium sp. TAE3-ERU12]|uniref:SDR family oxidoreductase n=1 Tax=Corynebacterium sp. TAE3-ERU12 TaxID=2849491 RepID=UPI001C45981D|nr:SDR family oxidoreductase [Corynebacterium sp. TAE3-ERU12]MBV7294392.1 SDR family oxidoreductase [Corynebacterium sp. TAE3-ERU12]